MKSTPTAALRLRIIAAHLEYHDLPAPLAIDFAGTETRIQVTLAAVARWATSLGVTAPTTTHRGRFGTAKFTANLMGEPTVTVTASGLTLASVTA